MPFEKPPRNLGIFSKKCPTVEVSMVHKAVLLSSIVTAVARRWYRSVAALTHPYSLGTLGRNVTPRKHMDNLCLKPGPHLWTPAKKYRRAIVAPSSRNSIIIDNEGYMFEVDESTGSPKGPGACGLPPLRIAYLFEHVYGCPHKSEWQGKGGDLARAMYRMSIP